MGAVAIIASLVSHVINNLSTSAIRFVADSIVIFWARSRAGADSAIDISKNICDCSAGAVVQSQS